MANLEKGNIVKFMNSKNELDGGTIVGFGTDEHGVEKAIINTISGHRVYVTKTELIAIPHQRKGTASDKLQKRLVKEIQEARHNSQVTPPTDANSEHPKGGYTPQALDLKILKEKVETLENENKRLREEIETTKCPYDVKMLIRTVKALKQSISDGIILSDDKNQAILPLLELIMEFNNIQEEKKE